jgi:hypothetical protein
MVVDEVSAPFEFEPVDTPLVCERCQRTEASQPPPRETRFETQGF